MRKKWGAKVPLVQKFHGAKVLGPFVPRERVFHGTKVPRVRKFSLWTFCSRQRKCRGTKSPDTVATISNCSLLLIYRPRKDERLSCSSWLTYGGRFTYISGHLSAVGRAQDSESSLVKDQHSTAAPWTQLDDSKGDYDRGFPFSRKFLEFYHKIACSRALWCTF